MGSKNEPGYFDCYTQALPDEPMFVLLARDSSAPAALVEDWLPNGNDRLIEATGRRLIRRSIGVLSTTALGGNKLHAPSRRLI